MKTLFHRFSLAVALLCSSVAFAEDPAPAQAPPLDAKDATAIRNDVKQLGQIFGIQSNLPATPKSQDGTTKDSAPQKTMADVADKAVTMAGQAIASIAANVQKVAPEVWRIMLLQQVVKGVKGIIIPVGILILLQVYIFFVNRYWWKAPEAPKTEPDDTHTWRIIITRVVPIMFSFGFAIWCFVALADAAGYLINPEFYAIQDLLRIILSSNEVPQ